MKSKRIKEIQEQSAKNKEEVRYLKDTISLLNSMVVGGETHSESSLARVRESMSILNGF